MMTQVVRAQVLNAGSGAHLRPRGSWPESVSRRIVGTLTDAEWHQEMIGLSCAARSRHVEQCFGCNQGVRIKWDFTHAILVLCIFADVNARGFWILHRYIPQPETQKLSWPGCRIHREHSQPIRSGPAGQQRPSRK